MSKYAFNVSISPSEVIELIKKNQSADLVHEEINDLGDNRYIGTLVFEKYFFRAGNRAALVVIVDNLHNPTEVRAIATGSSQGLIFNFDWGAADDFAHSIKDILKQYITQELG